MALRYIIEFGRFLENNWEKSDRKDLINQFKNYLKSFIEENNDHDISLKIAAKKTTLDMELKHFLGILVPIERKLSRGIVDHEYIILEGDSKAPTKTKRQPVSIILDNIRSSFNAGAIFRTSECLNLEKVYLCGYKGTPDDPKTKKTSMGTSDKIPWEWHPHADSLIDRLQQAGIAVIGVETEERAKSIYDFNFPKPCAILLGNERHGIDPILLKKCDAVVKIPLYGQKNSLNVGIAASIVAYQAIHQK